MISFVCLFIRVGPRPNARGLHNIRRHVIVSQTCLAPGAEPRARAGGQGQGPGQGPGAFIIELCDTNTVMSSPKGRAKGQGSGPRASRHCRVM